VRGRIKPFSSIITHPIQFQAAARRFLAGLGIFLKIVLAYRSRPLYIGDKGSEVIVHTLRLETKPLPD
jgi:hypothetical protein